MPLPIALQLYTVRDDAARDFKATLKTVAEMGYDGVEFAGLMGNSPADIKKWCAEYNLVPISAHVPLADLLADTEKTVADYAEIGCAYIAIPYVTEERRPGASGFAGTIEDIKKIGAVCKNAGMTLLYHNHDFEFVMLDGKRGLDVLYSSVDSSLLQTELDTCWVNIGGENPAEYIRKYTGRAPVVHLKDFHIEGKLPKHLYALIGLDEDEKHEEKSTFEFRPVGHGMQDMPAILAASKDAGAKWVVVEQDEPAPGQTREQSARLGIEYLKSISW
jgi:sugar phosphate isomerase/epimerase